MENMTGASQGYKDRNNKVRKCEWMAVKCEGDLDLGCH